MSSPGVSVVDGLTSCEVATQIIQEFRTGNRSIGRQAEEWFSKTSARIENTSMMTSRN
jgi:hypothetical protein